MKTKKTLITAVILAAVTATSFSVSAADIPQETAPNYASEESITVTENLISGILTEVQNGLGYGEANGKAQAIICKAVIDNQTNGIGYADLMSIARNSIFQYRDMYLRPEYYTQTEENLKPFLADLITEVENGTKDYYTARKEAYERICQTINPNFNYAEQMAVDSCYRDIPAVDGAVFNRTRKLLLEAEARRNIK